MKYQKQIVIAIFIILFSLLYNINISSGATATVNTDTLKLRKEASLEASVLELLNQGQELEVIEETGDWVKVKVKGMTGFVHKDYVKIEGQTTNNTQNKVENTANTVVENEISENVITEQNTITENTVETSTTINPEENKVQEPQTTNTNQVTQTVQVREETLKRNSNVFLLPLINANKISNLQKDTKVTILDEVKGWLYVETSQVSGWIRDNSLEQEEQTVQTSTTPEPPKQEENINKETPIDNKTMYINSSSVYIRKGPSTQDEIIDSLILNAQVVVIGEIEDWYKVNVNNKTGYIAKRLLSNSRTEATSRSAEERQEENEQEKPKENEITSSKGEQIVNYAKQFLGCKYVYGASGPSTFDCSGFTMYVYKQFGINLSHSATAQSKNGRYVAKENLQLGDLVFFKDYETMDGIGHCGIYIGDGNFIHASSGTGYCVKISTLLSGAYKTRYETARRLI